MGLDQVRKALRELGAEHLEAFALPQRVPSALEGIFAWLQHAALWELERRAGHEQVLRDPTADVQEIETALLALTTLAQQFRTRPDPAIDVERFLAAAAECLQRPTLH